MNFVEQGFAAAVNHVLARSPWATERLQAFAGQHFRIDATPVVIDAAIGADSLLAAAVPERAPDVTLTLPFAELPMLLAGGMDRLMNRVRIDGNAEFAEALGFVFRNLSWDVEEDLSKLVGDIPAHRLVAGARELRAAQARTAEALAGNLGEYLTEESGLIAARGDIEAFRDGIAVLRDGVARAEKRIERLSQPPKKPRRTS